MRECSSPANSALTGGENSERRRLLLPGHDLRTWLIAVPLALVVIAAFIPAADNGFVDWDDDQNFLDNPFYRGLGAPEIKWAWTTFRLGVYQPLAWMLFEAQYVFWKLDSPGYHVTSVILHVANAIVLYMLTVALLVRCQTDSWRKCPWTCSLGAGLATALFMAHPLRVEAVAWASCQPYLPCALFSMLAVLAYLRAFEISSCPRWRWLVAAFALFVMALLSHAVAVSLPAVLLILDVYPLQRFGNGPGWFGVPARKAWREKVPFILASLIFVGLAVAARRRDVFTIERPDASARIAQACYATWFYVVKTLLPLDLAVVYPLPREIDWLALPFILSILATVSVSVGAFLLRRRWPGLLASWMSYLVILAPNSGIIRDNDRIAADRYSYMAMLGWVMAVAFCLCRLGQTSSRRRGSMGMIVALGLAVLAGLILMSRDQCQTWRDSRTLWTHALAHGAGLSSRAHCGVGLDFEHRGNFEAAAAQYAEAVRVNPTDAAAHNGLGTALSHQGNDAEAEAQHTEALRLDPRSVNAHYNLGVILSRRGKDVEAIAHYLKALRLDPFFVDAHNNLGVILARQGRDTDATAQYAEALRLDPGSADAHNNLGVILSRQGRFEDAAAHYLEALRRKPASVDAHYNLGMVLSRQGKFEQAAAHYTEALRLNPGLANAHNNLGTDLSRQGKLAEAVVHYTKALQLDPRRTDTHNNLGIILSRQGKFGEAATHYAEALRLEPGYDEARKNLELDRMRQGKEQGPVAH
jgi:protein O-mannosyl-transferase